MDQLVFCFEKIVKEFLQLPLTKRNVLRVGGRFFDPSGIISPLVIQVKIIFQTICESKKDWDEEVDDETSAKMTTFMAELGDVKSISVPRFIGLGITRIINNVELHGFSDSSQKAYAAVVYVRFRVNEKFAMKLLCAKTKVAPLKAISIPRLELLGCLLLSKLMFTVNESLKTVINIEGMTYWTDSKICLHWIKNSKKEWVQWVERRVDKIRSLNEAISWYWVDSGKNPADIPTKEISVVEFRDNFLWWSGPKFLTNEGKEGWPAQSDYVEINKHDDVVIKELKQSFFFLFKVLTCSTLIKSGDGNVGDVDVGNLTDLIDNTRYSKLSKLLIVTSYVLRFINNVNRHKERCNYVRRNK